MISGVLLFFLLCTSHAFAQADKIELPDIELIIDDQSVLNTVSSENAILRERSPQFQEIYLEELTAQIEDASFEATVSQKYMNKQTCIRFMYGSYQNTQVKALSQDLINQLFYHISYKGQTRDNVQFKDHTYLNTGLYNNLLQSYFSYGISKAIVNLELDYQQAKNSFLNADEHSQYVHYVPVDITIKCWLTDRSYLDIGGNVHASIMENRSLTGIKTRSGYLLDSQFDISYNANLAEWNFFTCEIQYWLNDYNKNRLLHTGSVLIRSDFIFDKGFQLNIGAVVVGTSSYKVFGWPEIKVSYSYLEKAIIDFKFSGDYNIYNAEKSSSELQFFDLNPTIESKWSYAISGQFRPNAFLWFLGTAEYSHYQAKRIYTYDNKLHLYSFTSIPKIGLWNTSLTMGIDCGDIFDLVLVYIFETFPHDWLLYSRHKFDVLLGLGYAPAGFRFEARFTLYSPRNLDDIHRGSLVTLLKLKISQKIYNRVELFVELDNALNQNIQFISGTFYGGIQGHGGIQLNF